MTALDYLDSLQGSGIRPGLGRMRALLGALGRPERTCASIIVAGTNGKGSTAAMLASILEASGYHTGLYTSPHLVGIHERWVIGGKTIDDDLLERSVTRLREAARRIGITPTYFEALTIVAFIAFQLSSCEVVVLEVGMGGRLDATNVVRPIASVITPIGFDHMEFLGTTLRRIAAEKAGVIHRGAIVLTTNRDPQVLAVIERRAKKCGNRLIVVTDDHETPLAGSFQRQNAALAVRTARELKPLLPRISDESIVRGVASTRWRGRLEHLRAAGKEIWIDGGHNPHAAEAIRSFIERDIPAPRLLLFGIMGDKDVAAVARTLFPLFTRIIATEPYPPRSATASDLAALGQRLGIDAEAIVDPVQAVTRALDAPERSIVITGSLYLAGAAIDFFDKIAGRGERQ